MPTNFNNSSNGSQYVDVTHINEGNLPTSDLSRILPRQMSTGTMRGTQNVGYGGVKIDSSNNTITVGDVISISGNDDGLITVGNTNEGVQGIGIIPDGSGDDGFFQTDSTGKVIWKQVNGTTYTYNSADGYNNSERNGFAPDDGRPGLWFAKVGYDATKLLGG